MRAQAAPLSLAPASRGVLRRALAALGGWGRAWIEERRTRALVAQMDGPTLRDLGLNRYEVEEQLRAAALRRKAFLRGWRDL